MTAPIQVRRAGERVTLIRVQAASLADAMRERERLINKLAFDRPVHQFLMAQLSIQPDPEADGWFTMVRYRMGM